MRFNDRMDSLVETYLRALSTSDVELVLGLFAAGAVVHSPLYGPVPATTFYPMLFADTTQATLTLRSVMRGNTATGVPTISFWFRFDWVLPDGTPAPFEVVDVAELDANGLISRLFLIYDTVEVRPRFEAATGHRSWHDQAY